MKELKRSFFSLLFLVTVSLLFYSWAMNSLSQEEEQLASTCALFEEELHRVEQENCTLREKVNSLNDPSGEEYLLRKELGLCPKDGIKVQFSKGL